MLGLSSHYRRSRVDRSAQQNARIISADPHHYATGSNSIVPFKAPVPILNKVVVASLNGVSRLYKMRMSRVP